MNEKPVFLLTNDDGYHAEGLLTLRNALAPHGHVVVVAPETEQSTTSHSLSMHRPLRLRQIEDGVFAVDGTPADCVYLALHKDNHLLPRVPDLVVSGMNHGANLGSDVFYSGTVGAAREAALRGIQALAISADVRASRAEAAKLGVAMALACLAPTLSDRTAGPAPLWNLNIPPGRGPWALRPTLLGIRVYDDEIMVGTDPRGKPYYWIGGKGVSHRECPGSDTEAFDDGVASLTPLLLDLTAPAQRKAAIALAERVPLVDPNR